MQAAEGLWSVPDTVKEGCVQSHRDSMLSKIKTEVSGKWMVEIGKGVPLPGLGRDCGNGMATLQAEDQT